ncbi:MAG TPA: hypothetical protein VNI55_01760 [Gaiellaceae bacterium]|nr:hypothetical protein [Gaiellaceae bacterium]
MIPLRLISVSFERVTLAAEFAADDEVWRRNCSVLVSSGACRFPHGHDENGKSLGDPAADEQVRERAAEELVRLHAALELIEGARCAA